MKKQAESKIAKAYWKTEAGQNLANTMHSDGWEAVDCLNSVISALEKSIEAANATTREELEKARQQILAAKNAYWKAAAILSDDEF